MDSKYLQLLNALIPIFVTDDGISTFVKEEQFWKALNSIDVIVEGITTFVNFSHLLKVLFSICFCCKSK